MPLLLSRSVVSDTFETPVGFSRQHDWKQDVIPFSRGSS